MKKLLSMFMAIAIFLSVITLPVKADNDNGKIIIANPTIDETYSVYKIFDATLSFKDGKADGIAYSMERIKTENGVIGNEILFDELFGENGTKANDYFLYNPQTKEVKVKDGAKEEAIYTYLKELIEKVINPSSGTAYQPLQSVKAEMAKLDENKQLVFGSLPYGYYFVTSSLGSLVTINSTTPTVTVIDKNQKPGDEFGKFIQTGETPRLDSEGNPVTDVNGNVIMDPIWGKENSANIGDIVDYKVSFEATNYDGTHKIQYYQINDQKGDALWVEFNSVRVFVNGEELDRGYYLCQGDATLLDGKRWDKLGAWSGASESEITKENAEWYLVHLGFDQFRITIPWLEGHKLNETITTKDVNGETHEFRGYTLTYDNPETATFKYSSPAQIEVYYDAAVEYNASIGADKATSNLYNTANATWTYVGDKGTTSDDSTYTYVYGIGVTKTDLSDSDKLLAGAEFELYSDANCTEAIYVIPTKIDGVYILDSLGRAIENVSGANKETTREMYAAYLGDYLGTDYQKNLVVSQENGKFIILGLEKGTYYLKETKAPDGYTVKTDATPIVVGETTPSQFTIYADEEGNVTSVKGEGDLNYSEITYHLYNVNIENGRGATLPTTGAEGTIKLITIGSFITIACGILLITNKKMSVYRD